MKGYFRKRGNLWSFTVDIGRKTDGSRNQKTKSGFKTKKEAEQACAELITQLSKVITWNRVKSRYRRLWKLG